MPSPPPKNPGMAGSVPTGFSWDRTHAHKLTPHPHAAPHAAPHGAAASCRHRIPTPPAGQPATHALLHEVTTYRFSATRQERIIDRTTVLTADTDVNFPDAKDGMLGLRVTKELQIPSNTPGEFVDDKGNITKVAAGNTPDINGNYLTSEGKTGDSAWGTRGQWCMLYGKKGGDTLSIAIIDYPGNPGYPTYWHARGYGLFAANPLGQKIFSTGPAGTQLSTEKRTVRHFPLPHSHSCR